MSPGAVCSEDEGILTVTFTRDEKLNAVDDSMVDVLRQAVTATGDRADIRVLVIRGAGRYFTAGIDVSRFAAGQVDSGIVLRRQYRRLHLLFDEIEAIEKPVIVAAQGPCLGFGVELAVSCDFRLATTRATFALPEITNLAVLPGSGGISRLTRLVGPHWARWLAMAAQPVDARQAQAIGLVHQVLPEEGFDDAVRHFASSLTALSPEALGLAKMTIEAAVGADRSTARNIDRMANTLLLGSDEHRQAVARFANRRRS